jgi:Ni/Fe-hydrogenase subunit HybB-like protein
MVILECSLCNRVFGRGLHLEVLQGLGRALFVVLGLLLGIKLVDLAVAGELGLMFEGSVQSNMFLLENVVGILLPMALLLAPRFRRDGSWLFRIGLLVVLGLILHRFNVSFNGMAGTSYVPHWMELAVTAGVISAGLLAFGLAVRHLPIGEEIGEGH